mmetsp:Transcript_2705/g.6514  ORF Transcript_2705/g.6514 Transcript_2705/m.6514 type:complete len:870 (-) Transcript_2705:226-2835(-)
MRLQARCDKLAHAALLKEQQIVGAQGVIKSLENTLAADVDVTTRLKEIQEQVEREEHNIHLEETEGRMLQWMLKRVAAESIVLQNRIMTLSSHSNSFADKCERVKRLRNKAFKEREDAVNQQAQVTQLAQEGRQRQQLEFSAKKREADELVLTVDSLQKEKERAAQELQERQKRIDQFAAQSQSQEDTLDWLSKMKVRESGTRDQLEVDFRCIVETVSSKVMRVETEQERRQVLQALSEALVVEDPGKLELLSGAVLHTTMTKAELEVAALPLELRFYGTKESEETMDCSPERVREIITRYTATVQEQVALDNRIRHSLEEIAQLNQVRGHLQQELKDLGPLRQDTDAELREKLFLAREREAIQAQGKCRGKEAVWQQSKALLESAVTGFKTLLKKIELADPAEVLGPHSLHRSAALTSELEKEPTSRAAEDIPSEQAVLAMVTTLEQQLTHAMEMISRHGKVPGARGRLRTGTDPVVDPDLSPPRSAMESAPPTPLDRSSRSTVFTSREARHELGLLDDEEVEEQPAQPEDSFTMFRSYWALQAAELVDKAATRKKQRAMFLTAEEEEEQRLDKEHTEAQEEELSFAEEERSRVRDTPVERPREANTEKVRRNKRPDSFNQIRVRKGKGDYDLTVVHNQQEKWSRELAGQLASVETKIHELFVKTLSGSVGATDQELWALSRRAARPPVRAAKAKTKEPAAAAGAAPRPASASSRARVPFRMETGEQRMKRAQMREARNEERELMKLVQQTVATEKDLMAARRVFTEATHQDEVLLADGVVQANESLEPVDPAGRVQARFQRAFGSLHNLKHSGKLSKLVASRSQSIGQLSPEIAKTLRHSTRLGTGKLSTLGRPTSTASIAPMGWSG